MNHDKKPADAETRRVYAELRAALEAGREDDQWISDWDFSLGCLAGLLIANWAGYRAAELPAENQPVGDHARDLVNALWRAQNTGGHIRYLKPVSLPVRVAANHMPEMYRGLVTWVRGIDLGSSEGTRVAADAFDAALRHVVRRSDAGECITPARVADLMLEIAKPQPGETLYDPCFGFAEILVRAARRLGMAAYDSAIEADAAGTLLFGVESGPAQYAIGWCRLLLAGAHGHGLQYEDTLDPLEPDSPNDHPADGFDCILAIPPWGRWETGSESQFLRHVMARLRPGGRAIVAMSEGALYRSGAESRARKALLSEFSVDAVVGLPNGAFVPYASLPGSLVAFSRAEPRSAVRFVRVSHGAWASAAPDDGDGGVGYLGGMSESTERGHARRSFGVLLRGISDLISQPAGRSVEPSLPGVETWEVSMRELEQRGHELIVKKSGSETLRREIARLVAADATLRAPRLCEVAEVSAGLGYDRRVATQQRARGDVAAGLLRVGDVTSMGVRAPSLFFTGAAPARPRQGALLRSGDVVVTKESTVGRVGLITRGSPAIGALATRGMAVIRVRSGLRPPFVAALLRSPAYQNWMSGHARGLTIERLSIGVLRTLTIPVPPEDVQDSVLHELGGHHGDALAVLLRVLSGMSNPVSAWLETPLAARLATGVPRADDGLSMLTELAAELRSIDLPAAFDAEDRGADDRTTSLWLTMVRRAAEALHGIESVPSGSARLAILEFAVARFHEARGIVDRAEGRIGERLRSLTRALAELAEQEAHAVQRAVTLDVKVIPAEVEAEVASEVRLQVTNASSMPLRNVQVTALQPDGAVAQDEVGYLAERGTHEIPLAVRAQRRPRPVRIAVSWQARRLDATAVPPGEKNVSLLVRANGRPAASGDLQANPYVVGSPVDRAEMFFGRDDVMTKIKRQLGHTHANVTLLEGNRRTGKTSILKQLAKAPDLQGWIPVYCSLQDVDSIATNHVFRLLARQTGWALYDAGVETWIPGLPRTDSGRPFKAGFSAVLARAFAGGNPFETFRDYLSAALEAAEPRRILLMLDEFDKLQEGIEAGVSSPQVPENIRHLLQHQPGLCAIIAGSRRLKRLREEYWSALFGLGYRVGIGALADADARKLVTDPVAGQLRYLPKARDRLVRLCAGHPFLIQSLCSRVFDRASDGNERTLTEEIVEQSAGEMVGDNEHFRTLWGYAGSARRRLLLAICARLAERSDAVTLNLLEAKLHEECGVNVRRQDELADDITELRELELLDLDHGRDTSLGRLPRQARQVYRLCVPLMAMWIEANVDFDDLVVRARQETEHNDYGLPGGGRLVG